MTAADAWDEREGPGGPDFEPIVPLRKPKRGKGLLYAVAAIVVLAGSGAAGWYLWGDSLLMDPDTEIPLVRADGGPIKVRPESPGGMDIPDRDKLVYDRIDGNGERAEIERLLPPPETPQPLPEPPAGTQPAEQPAPGGEMPQTAEAAPTQLVPEQAPEAAQPSAPPPAPPASEPAPTVAEVLSTMRPPPPPDKAETTPEPAPAAPAETAMKAEPEPEPAPTLAPASEAPAKPEPKPVETASAPAAPATAESGGGGYRIQLAAVRDRQAVEPEWKRLQKKNTDLLGPLELSVQKADLGPGKGIYYRLRAGPLADEATARDLCAKLKERKVGCLVVRPKG